MKAISQLISIIFHPLLIISYILLVLLLVHPYTFNFADEKDKVLLTASVISLTFIFPCITIMMMRALGLVHSLEMQDPKERIGPLVSTGIFYLWLFINIKNHSGFPNAFKIFVLGSVISLFIAFFLNNFTKVSLHTTGIGGFMAMIFILTFFFSYQSFYLSITDQMNFELGSGFLLLITFLITGLVGTARLYLKAHSREEVFGGYLIGIFGQLVAFKILFES